MGNIVWLIVAGILLAIGNFFAGVALCITIIGIPLGLACFKLIPVSLVPLGKIIVPTETPWPTKRLRREGAGDSTTFAARLAALRLARHHSSPLSTVRVGD